MKSRSTWSDRRAVTATGPTSASAAGQDDGAVRAVRGVEDVGDVDRVRDDGQVRDPDEVVREAPGRRAGGERDRLARLDELARGARNRLLLVQLPVRLLLEARLVGAREPPDRRAAVHLLEQARGGQDVEVPADRHVGDAQQLRQLAHAHRSAPTHLLDDQHLTLGGQHRESDNTQQSSTRLGAAQNVVT
jgi:hypothetical protein